MHFVDLPLDTLQNVLCLGVAGNFAGHLEQAGETPDFVHVKTASASAPKGLFPIYVPNDPGFLGVFPLSNTAITYPKHLAQSAHLQAEPELCVLFNVTYDHTQTPPRVVNLCPQALGAFNDCSIRQPNASKISQKKNWGARSKGIAQTFIALNNFAPGGQLDTLRIASFLARDNQVVEYGQNSPVTSYSYFYQPLLTWIIAQLNQQTDFGPLENLPNLLAQTGYPSTMLISLGATQYTPFGQSHFLQPGDQLWVIVYDATQNSADTLTDFVQHTFNHSNDALITPLTPFQPPQPLKNSSVLQQIIQL